MPCHNPTMLFRSGQGREWNEQLRIFGGYVGFACGQCRWCRFVKSRQWAIRCYCENQMHTQSAFINLSYSSEHLPANGSLSKEHVQKFLKRLRRNLEYQDADIKIRFYASGEYGEKNERPHYHILIFGYGFPDKYFWKKSEKNFPLYRSAFLEKCWKLGHSWIGDVDLESAAYVAKYISKKINGCMAKEHYRGREPEFSLQSSTPGIGGDWYQKNKRWLWREDVIRCAGRNYRPPLYFERILKQEDPEEYEELLRRKPLRLPFNTLNVIDQAVEIPDEQEQVVHE